MKHELTLIGIGSSAGGLEALRLLLSGINIKDDYIAYVVIQHLSPSHKSTLRELLSLETQYEVLDIIDGVLPKPKTVYIVPPNHNVILRNGLLHLEKIPTEWIGPKPSIDKFFLSLAQEKGKNAVGIILSGTGFDGSQGIRAIKSEGGVTIVQDPNEAKFDGMPIAAIKTKAIDYILPAKQMHDEIVYILNYSNSLHLEEEENSSAIRLIFNTLKNRIGVDFSQYKKGTITRRIERRMAAIKSLSIEDYAKYIEENSEEAELLYQDMLIGVTSFFRDKDAFDAFGVQIKKYLETVKEDTLRIWVTACATGEEAYSLAILLDEILGSKTRIHIKIFATDIDENAIKKAREGKYSEVSIASLSKERKKLYFTQRGDKYEIKPFLKERVIFSKHNIITDPPFMHLDIILCRNLLIYFENDLQQIIFNIFAYTLKNNGLLFLGKSETIGTFTDYFATIDLKNKIFQARSTTELRKTLYPKMFFINTRYIAPSKSKELKHTGNIEDTIKQTLFEYYEEKSIVIDNDFNLHYIKGNLNGLLKIPSGVVNNNILKMLPDVLSIEIRSAIYKINKENTKTIFPLTIKTIYNDKFYKIRISPLEGYTGNYLLFLISFEIEHVSNNIRTSSDNSSSNNAKIHFLEQELTATREHLQTVIEELEASNEELQASNEELQASNEELQASNEGLETTNEELQSTNEELQSAYTEIRTLYEKQNYQKQQLLKKTEELTHLQYELKAQYEYLKHILDTEENIVITTDGRLLSSVNAKFLQFFSEYNSLEEFNKKHNCICDFFEKVEDEGYVYDGKDGQNWIDQILLSSRNDMKVCIKRGEKQFTFHVMASSLSLNQTDKQYTVTFTDITDIIAQNNNLYLTQQREQANKFCKTQILFDIQEALGINEFIHNILQNQKNSLNKVYRLYLQSFEVSNQTKEQHYLQQFQIEKEKFLHNMALLQNFFIGSDEVSLEINEIIHELADIFNQDKKFCEVKFIVSGDTQLEYKDYPKKIYLFLYGLMLFNIRLIKRLKTTQSHKIEINIKKEKKETIISFSSPGSNDLYKEVIFLDAQEDTFLVKKDQMILNMLSLLKSITEEFYKGQLKINNNNFQVILK